jgi:hypothetical protein
MLPHCLGNPQRNHRHFHRPKVLVANPGLCHNRNQSERGGHEIHELHKLAGLVADPYRVYGVGVALSLDCEDAARKTRAPGLRPVLLTFKMFSVCKDFFHGVYAATAVS